MTGTEISNYRILEKLGEGGMGVVYKAVDVNLDRTVAIKALNTELTGNPELEQRFRGEARAWLSRSIPRDVAPPDTREGFEQHRAWERALFDAGFAGLSWPSRSEAEAWTSSIKRSSKRNTCSRTGPNG